MIEVRADRKDIHIPLDEITAKSSQAFEIGDIHLPISRSYRF
jgi:hypothetical protein